MQWCFIVIGMDRWTKWGGRTNRTSSKLILRSLNHISSQPWTPAPAVLKTKVHITCWWYFKMTHRDELTATMKTHNDRLCMYDALFADMFPPTQTRTGSRLVRDLSARKSHWKYFFFQAQVSINFILICVYSRSTATHLVSMLGLFWPMLNKQTFQIVNLIIFVLV